MGSKVNIKFVAILSAVVVGVVGVLAVPAYFVLTKSAEDHVRAGDRALEDGDIKQAITEYGKAVNEERSNVVYVRKWRDAIEQFTPSDQTEYRKYFGQLYGAVYEIARAARSDVAAWEEYFEFARQADSATRIEERARAANDTLGRTDPQGAAVLRRYMALPKLNEWTSGERQLEPDEIEILEENLRAALAVRTDDHEVVRGLVTMHRYLSEQAARNFNDAEAARHAQAALDVAREAVREHPDHPIMRMIEMEILASRALRERIGDPLQPGERLVDIEAVDEVAALLAAWPAEEIGLEEISTLQRMEMLGGAGRIERALELTERLVRERPEDMLMRWGRAFALRLTGQPEAAYRELQVILDRPMQTVSIEGYRQFRLQDRALFSQSGLAFTQWEQSLNDEDARGIALDRMRSRNEEMTRRLAADSPLLLMARARIAYAENDIREAGRLLREYESRVGPEDSDANWMLAQLAIRAGNLTEAGRRIDTYMEQNPGEVRAMMIRAEIHARAGEDEEAIKILRPLNQAMPENRIIAEALDGLLKRSGELAIEDPVQAVLVASTDAERGSEDTLGDAARAAAIVEDAIATGMNSPMLYRRLAQIRMNQDDVDGAREVIQRGLAAHGEDADLQRLWEMLASSENVLDVMLAMIEASDASELQKLSLKAKACWDRRAYERAREYVDRAMEIDPENASVVEYAFRLALLDGDAARAESLAQTAQRLDLDGVGGRIYLADVRASNGERDLAIGLLEEAVDLRPDRVDLLRRLGRLQFAGGRVGEGLATFDRAMAMRGNDQSLILDYASQLQSVGRSEEALRLLLDKQEQTRGNDVIFDLRIDLESEVGNRQWALQTRETIAQREPANRANKAKLARLYMDLAAWGKAKPLIDELREGGDSMELATLAARWHGDQGNIEGAREEFTEYIAALFAARGDLSDPTAYLRLGQILIQYGDAQGGLEAVRQARRWEDPQTLRVEKFLADRLATLNLWNEAIESYKTIVEGEKDTPEATYAIRLAEAYGRIGQYEEAERILASLDDLASRNESILLLRSQNALRMGETDRAQDHVRRAIELFPDSARPYAQRARLALGLALRTGNERLLTDALEDLTTAVARDTTYVEAYQMRSQVNAYLGRRDDMLSDLRAAIFARPPTDATVAQSIEVFVRAGRARGAVEIAEHAKSTRPNDIGLLKEIGGAFSDAGDWGRASTYFGQAWERSKDISTASQYVQALLRSDPPRPRVAMDALGVLGEQVRDRPGLLLMRAEALKLGGQLDFAIEDARRAFALLVESPQGLAIWFSEVNRIFDTPDELVAVVEACKRAGQLRLQLDLFAARGLAAHPESLSRSLTIFDGLIAQTGDPTIRRLATIFKGAALMEHDRFEEAVSEWRRGLELAPEEWQLHNNIAYVLGTGLGKPEEALSFAEQAFELAPNQSAVVDTLGWIQHLSGDDDAAELSLERAVSLIGSPENDPTIGLHLAIVRAALGKKELARNLVRAIGSRSQNGANLSAADRELLNEASERIDSLP